MAALTARRPPDEPEGAPIVAVMRGRWTAAAGPAAPNRMRYRPRDGGAFLSGGVFAQEGRRNSGEGRTAAREEPRGRGELFAKVGDGMKG